MADPLSQERGCQLQECDAEEMRRQTAGRQLSYLHTDQHAVLSMYTSTVYLPGKIRGCRWLNRSLNKLPAQERTMDEYAPPHVRNNRKLAAGLAKQKKGRRSEKRRESP